MPNFIKGLACIEKDCRTMLLRSNDLLITEIFLLNAVCETQTDNPKENLSGVVNPAIIAFQEN